MKKEIGEIRKALKAKSPETPIPSKDFLSMGATVLDLACSGRRKGAIVKGMYVWLVGDSESGKTFTAYTCLAEASINKNFEDYRFIVDQIEDGALMDVSHFFGVAVAERIEPPEGTKDDPIYSRSVDDLFYHIDDAHKVGKPFIYIADSYDALDTIEDVRKFDETKKIRRGNSAKKETGSYGTSKPKLTSSGLRKAVGKLKDTGSILIIISQTRDNIGFGSMFEPKVAAGGRALKFYAGLEIWTSVKKTIKKTVMGKKRTLGIICRAQIKKNRITGRKRSVDIPIFWSIGISDIDACINFLVDEGYWKGSETGDKIEAKDFDFKGAKDDLARKIEKEGLDKELKVLVGQVWKNIDLACVVERKVRYR